MNKVKINGKLPPHIKNIIDKNEMTTVNVDSLSDQYLFDDNGILSMMTQKMLERKERPLFIDLEKLLKYHQKKKYSINKELLAKALGRGELRKSKVYDLTCGMGNDLALMLSFGVKEVCAFERDPYVFLLLYDAWKRAGLCDLENVELFYGDYLRNEGNFPTTGDIMYFDPMFEHLGKRKSLQKKEMRIFQEVISNFDPELNLFPKFKTLSFSKLIIKRPLSGEFYLEEKPSCSFHGKSIRYDVYLKVR